jgi:hypothetical protein
MTPTATYDPFASCLQSIEFIARTQSDVIVPEPCSTSHGCNRAKLIVLANNIQIGIINLNNGGGGNHSSSPYTVFGDYSWDDYNFDPLDPTALYFSGYGPTYGVLPLGSNPDLLGIPRRGVEGTATYSGNRYSRVVMSGDLARQVSQASVGGMINFSLFCPNGTGPDDCHSDVTWLQINKFDPLTQQWVNIYDGCPSGNWGETLVSIDPCPSLITPTPTQTMTMTPTPTLTPASEPACIQYEISIHAFGDAVITYTPCCGEAPPPKTINGNGTVCSTTMPEFVSGFGLRINNGPCPSC